MTISVGDKIPEGTFKYVPYTPELENGVSPSLMILTPNVWLISPNASWSVVSVSDIEVIWYHKRLQPILFFQILATVLSTNDWKGKKVVLFSVPGAFTVGNFEFTRKYHGILTRNQTIFLK